VLAEDAIRSAIKDYKSKRSALSSSKQQSTIDLSQTAALASANAAATSA
jgi:iron-sulfur cluster assembly enzyme ISCU, mitochondrial